MSNELTVQQQTTAIVPASEAVMERVIINGDLSKLAPIERVTYYNSVCHSLGLNPLTQPFGYLFLQNKLTLYANRNCTDQLRSLRNVSINIVARERIDDLYIVTARATMPDGRIDESTGIVSIAGKRGDELANALMKAETKAKRRATLSIVGLGWIDETEIETVKGARVVSVDQATGEIVEPAVQPVQPVQEGTAEPEEQEKKPTRGELLMSLKKARDRLIALGIETKLGPNDISRMTDQQVADRITLYTDRANDHERQQAKKQATELFQ